MLGRIKRISFTRRVKQSESQGQKGQSLVELTIIAPLLLLLFIGVLEVGWALRGYIVLYNATREATRFSVRGQYLDFGQTDRNDVGYGTVLSHTLDSISQQLAFDVISDNPNGTLIISHYLVDTGRPCEDPPCAASIADCSDPAKREADYQADDLILHPGLDGYEHFTALYGIVRSSRIQPAQMAADLKEQNDAFNCALNLKDPAVPWSVNSVIVVESFYDQPQLLGVPIISNYYTDPVPLYAHAVMRVSSDARGQAGGSQGVGCEVYPIAVNRDTLDPFSPGDYIGDGWDGVGDGNFGWLRWNPDPSNNNTDYLQQELSNPRMSMNDFIDANEPEDTTLNAGDDVAGLTGVTNADQVRDVMESLIGKTIRILVWDPTQSGGSGQNTYYHVDRFVKVQIVSARLPGKTIDMIFVDEDPDACQGGDGDGGDPPGGDDDDSDGIPNSVEDFDGDGDPANDDADGDSTPNYLDTDSDDDGILDSAEGSGDADGDGMPNYLDTDSDGDGIGDSTEGSGDADGDGAANFLDTDADGDSIPDSTEGPGDADGDGTPSYLDTDSDNDSISDSIEGSGDTDGDGTPDYLDTDSDNDSISDGVEGIGDADGDSMPNYVDTDSDGDGIPDSTEGPGDADGDGTPDYLDTDSDGDSIPDSTEGLGDADGDGTPNYLDTDSDGDGTPDSVEGTGDDDGDGTPNYLDPDTPGGSATIASDGFESGNWSGGSGWSNNWNTNNDVSISTSGEHGGSYHVRLRGNNGRITRRVNMSGVSNARLQFWWKAKSFEGSEYARVRVYDGSWHTVLTVNNGQDDNTYHYADIDISGYNMVSDFRVRFESKMNSSHDYFYVDDIEVIGN